MKILVTGCAGFIGFHLTNTLLKNKKNTVIGIDSINDYYDQKLKKYRIKVLKKKNNKKFKFFKYDLKNNVLLNKIFNKDKIQVVIHLAGQAGVRYSFINPRSYLDNNLISFFNIIEASRKNKVKHFLFASTSSVYGDAKKFPVKENDSTDSPLSFYAATKKSNEVMAHSYSSMFKLKCTALRFFTVYGPLGRPDMALFKFTKNILAGKKIDLFNHGKHHRDFTYVDDIIQLIIKLISKPSKSKVPYDVFNLGNGKSRQLKDYLNAIEKKLNKKSIKNFLQLQKGDVFKTHASTLKVYKKTKYKPKTTIEKGISHFIDWYKNFLNVK
jgi:UDP-glucuronate 4-epimerase